MNKKAKIAMVATSVVMAGTMVLGVTGCTSNAPTTTDTGYDVTIGIAAGNSKDITTSISFRDLEDQITLSDGVTYQVGDLKPAWQALSDRLEVNIEDKWTGTDAGNHLPNAINGTEGYVDDKAWENIDIITTNLSKVDATTKPKLLNLYDYLDMMPNYKAFLKENPVVELSILSNMEKGKEELYVTPYFDGNDDVERFCIIRQDWAAKILNGTEALANDGEALSADYAKAQAEHKTTGKVAVEITDMSDVTKTKTIYKNYDNVLTLIGTSGSALDTAYKAATNGVAYAGASGNIIDIMNSAIATGKATGKTIVGIFRAYVDACYTNADNSSYYTADKRANLFNGADAAWDVDDMVAMLRCVVNNSANICAEGETAVGIFPRDNTFDRTPDLMSLAAQFYGVRGATSRLEYTYITQSGELKDMKNDIATYQACAKMNLLKQEGLIANYSSPNDSAAEYRYQNTGKKQGFLMFDYVQTQTQYNFYAEDSDLTGVNVDEGYYFAPIYNPLASWDVNDNGIHGEDGEYFRFAESWRSVKTNGWAVNANVANDPAKLNKVLQLLDFMYSQEGQILMTYGPMADANGNGGFWYNAPATADQIANGEYFIYRGVKYSGTEYIGRYTPTLTTKTMNLFKGKTVNGWSVSDDAKVSNAKLNYTNFARKLIGSCLPVGIVKDQGFENQLTAEAGKAGTVIVGYGISNGTIKHPVLQIEKGNYWFTEVLTALPYTSAESSAMTASPAQDKVRGLTSRVGSSKKIYSIFTEMMLNGLTSREVNTADEKAGKYTMGTTPEACMSLVQDGTNLENRIKNMNAAWQRVLEYLGQK
ncbi:MAG: hypothetical protein ACI4MS_05165 [Candidatus Coproplasma sp.]